MDVIFNSNKNANVKLVYTGRKQYEFNVIAKSDCFVSFVRIFISKEVITCFRNNLMSLYKLDIKSTELVSEGRKLRLGISVDDYGHLYYVFNIKNSDEIINSEIKMEADLSYLPDIIEQLDNILNEKGERVLQEPEEKEKSAADVVISVMDETENRNLQINLKIHSYSFDINRNLELIDLEEDIFLKKINSFFTTKEKMSIYPLGEFANFSLSWNNNTAWINGSVSDYEYPYNSIDFNVPCNLTIMESWGQILYSEAMR